MVDYVEKQLLGMVPGRRGGAPAPAGPHFGAGAAAPPGAGPQNSAGAAAPPGPGPLKSAGARGPAGANPGPRKTLIFTKELTQKM